MAIKPKLGDIVYCEWLDHTSHDDWFDSVADVNETAGLATIKTAGFYISEDKDVLRIALNYDVYINGQGKHSSISCIMAIVKRCIEKLTIVKRVQ